MRPSGADRELCGAPTAAGGACRNFEETCPHRSHAQQRPRASRPSALADMPEVPVVRRGPAFSGTVRFGESSPQHGRLASRPESFEPLVEAAATRFGLNREQVERDYWIVCALSETASMLGPDAAVPRRQAPGPPVGTLAFAGGTSLSAAWDLSSRYSEDLDLVLNPAVGVKSRRIKTALRAFAVALARRLGGSCQISGHSSEHIFFAVVAASGTSVAVDVSVRNLNAAEIMRQRQPITSLLGRVCDSDARAAFPEIGGRSTPTAGPTGLMFPTLGPCSTAMDKLLAHTSLSQRGDCAAIRRRARDLYDLASIALAATDFEGHIGRDSPRLLGMSEQWRREADGAVRPDGGFSSLHVFKPSTPEHAALREGYEEVTTSMVWGRQIAFADAVDLALSLDPGPAVDGAATRTYPDGVSYP